MKKRTMQEAFDTAYRGVVKQGRPAVDDDGTCLFIDADGCRCNIGHLLTLDDAEQANNKPISYALTAAKDHLTDAGDPDKFIIDLMGAHDQISDGPDFLSDYKSCMAVVASKYGLTVPEDV